MQISIVSFQKQRRTDLDAAEQEYIKRLSRWVQVELCPVRNFDDASGIPGRFLQGQRIVGLFVEGKRFSSEGLAQRLQALMSRGNSHLVLVIGAAEGMPRAAVEQVHERWSLSSLTFSHQLSRLVLLEALCRAFDIQAAGRYHK